MSLFDPIAGQIAVADPQGDLWVVSGRIPGDDDDTTCMIQASTEQQAKTLFERLLYEIFGSADEIGMEKDHAVSVYGTSRYIITCDRVAVLVPKELGTTAGQG
ncbi:hypothetical protein OF001_U20230 [Pseudomonas sp. OF001]|uniref:hypothetical protein n=1 Tax=Pseudomonas sp. OF001 TaxID=2772300 RepID=UPI00191A5409|nr:hypothetical protein [Pseudomonas sp. OF001]CAD5377303.1 hypothetical protein OF001_U20230 [Pseudomonas sp. OF001]